ncbi:MAG: alpha/beta hydrolase, partial [Euryarchaeota archaeon]|nr:alpha/beta hydrolase [Euryarchaeota archaeon]
MITQPLVAQEKITFNSANPFNFRDIIVNLEKQESQEVFGTLKLPKTNTENEKFPLIIALAGSKGWAEHHTAYLQMYREMGIATFEVNSFKSRNVTSTVGSQIAVTTAMMILDSYKALDVLCNHPNINSDKIAVTGWSLGGGVALYAGWEPLRKAINPAHSFVAHLAFYPPCIVEPLNLNFTSAPFRILIGELDNWTPADPCVELVSKLQDSGADINIAVYPESHHSFDRESDPIIDPEGYVLTKCRYKMKNDGTILTNRLNFPIRTPL